MKRASILASTVVAVVLGIAACDGDEANVGPKPYEFKPGETWTGYVEKFKFQSGSDRIWIAFTTPTTGTVTFGAPAVENEAINPDIGYPVGLVVKAQGIVDLPKQAERFAFTMLDVSRDDVRLQFTVDLREIWTRWCAAQTPVPSSWGEGFGCIPVVYPPEVTFPADGSGCSFLTAPESTNRTSVDCGKAALCAVMAACTCDAAHCERTRTDFAVFDAAPPNVWEFDIRLTGGEGEGSSDPGRVYLTRQ